MTQRNPQRALRNLQRSLNAHGGGTRLPTHSKGAHRIQRLSTLPHNCSKPLDVGQEGRAAVIPGASFAVQGERKYATFFEPKRTPNSEKVSATSEANEPEEIKEAIELDIGGRRHSFSPIKIRDSCTCERCVDPSTNQKLIYTFDISPKIKAKDVRSTSEGVVIRWENDHHSVGDDHETVLTSVALDSLARLGRVLPHRSSPRQIPWDSADIRKSVPDTSYESYMTDERVLYQAVYNLHKYGFVYVTGVPEDETSVENLAERIGVLKTTFYGRTWDVRSVPDAINVAYTAQDLGFHMDLCYMEQPPHLQLLHCIRASSAGGASVFTDSYKALQLLAREHPADFSTLQHVQIGFHYNHPDSNLYAQKRAVLEPQSHLWAKRSIEMDPQSRLGAIRRKAAKGEIRANVFWSPPFQSPLDMHDPMVEKWHHAARTFNGLLHRPEAIHERMMKPGECVIFDNRRVLHARKAFEVGDIGKERWLKGCYVDMDPYKSKLHTLMHRFGKDPDAAGIEGQTSKQASK